MYDPVAVPLKLGTVTAWLTPHVSALRIFREECARRQGSLFSFVKNIS